MDHRTTVLKKLHWFFPLIHTPQLFNFRLFGYNSGSHKSKLYTSSADIKRHSPPQIVLVIFLFHYRLTLIHLMHCQYKKMNSREKTS